MNRQQRERDLLWVFDAGLVLKLIGGITDILTGVLVLFVRPSFVLKLAEIATAGELAQDPNDPIATAIRAAAHSFAVHTHYLIALYLLLHGFVKALLVVLIFAGYRHAFPLFIGALGVFAAYEAYRSAVTGGAFLAILAAFDLVLLLLASHEYRVRGAHAAALTLRQGTGR